MKQKSKKWFSAKSKRIGSSEIFSLVQRYATRDELLNCGLQPEEVYEEKAFDSPFILYHKMKGEITIHHKELPISLGKYGNAMEYFAKDWIKKNLELNSIKQGEVYIDKDNIRIASCDIECDVKNCLLKSSNGEFLDTISNHSGIIEVKTVHSSKWAKNGVSVRTKIQQAWQMMLSGKYVGGIMSIILADDNAENRCYLAGLYESSKKKFLTKAEELIDRVYIDWYSFDKSYIGLFSVVLDRFLADVENGNCPILYTDEESPKVVFDAIREYQEKTRLPVDFAETNLSGYIKAKEEFDKAKEALDIKKTALMNLLYDKKTLEARDEENQKVLKIDKRNAISVKDMK